MPAFNRVVLIGNLTRDIELKEVSNGAIVGNLPLAINESYKAQDGTIRENVVYVDVEVWGKQAESCAKFLRRGRPCLVEGRLKLDVWENAAGEKRRRLGVRGDRVVFLGAAPSTTTASSTADEQPPIDDDPL